MSNQRRQTITAIPLETAEIPQSLLNIEWKDRSSLFSWNGQFSPQFVEALLNAYATPEMTVLDPFAGSGTVLYEAGRQQIQALAAEINPAACALATLYSLINLDRSARTGSLARLEETLTKALPEELPLFTQAATQVSGMELERLLVGLALSESDSVGRQLLAALVTLLDFRQAELDSARVRATWSKLKQRVLSLPYSPRRLVVYNCDARALPLGGEQIDLIITSPPYINVFNYHQQYRASAEALGWEMLKVAQSEMGANRKNRGNRFLTVVQYCLDLAQALAHWFTLLKPAGRVIIVVGRESQVRGVSFQNGEIVGKLGVYCAGFALKLRQERVFKNRFGQLIYEDILHFTKPPRPAPTQLTPAVEIAADVLAEAAQNLAPEIALALAAARAGARAVTPSPLYQAAATYRGQLTESYQSAVRKAAVEQNWLG